LPNHQAIIANDDDELATIPVASRNYVDKNEVRRHALIELESPIWIIRGSLHKLAFPICFQVTDVYDGTFFFAPNAISRTTIAFTAVTTE
jgi:hypothetical protein